MKKPLGVISLVVLLCVQILTPVTYAVGDDDFVSETYVEESASEEVVEAADDADEVSDEVSEEDDASEEATEEDSSDEDSQDEDTLEGEEDSADAEESDVLEEEVSDPEGEEVSAGSSEESVSEESPVLSEEDEAFITKLSKQGSVAKIAEELGINWYTDSSKWAEAAGIEGKYLGTKEQNNIIREYFIQHAREILGAEESNEVVNEEVVEEPEVVELNKEEISGKKYYNGVTAIVIAPINTFPEGTTLSIVPIKAKKDLKEIKEQLVEQQDEVTEESNVVAFDISFLYSGEEVQPVSGQTVQVTFNYGNHEKLSEANEDEEQELKVYHLNDKDGSGNKVEDIAEVKVEEVEIVKNEEGELVVDAESFSVYTIVTQVAEGPKALEDQLANFKYGMISIARPDSLSGKYFDVLGFTIMDRNLGAEKIGAYTDLTTTGSYGYHYQWGNNYGFISYTGLSDGYKTGNKIDVNGKTEYSGNQFVLGSSNNTWMSGGNNDNLWTGDNKQGPCPEGWHVPTAKEWSQLLEFYVYENYFNETGMLQGSNYKYISNVDVASGFAHYFKIPFAGYRYKVDAGVKYQGSYAYLWSSSPRSVNSNSAYYLSLYSSAVSVNGVIDRAEGVSVRCFKNSYEGTGAFNLITFDYDGGTGSTAQIQVASGEKAVEPSKRPVKEGYVFGGWYSNEGLTSKFDFSNTVISGNITLYAKWSDSDACDFAYNHVDGGYEVVGFTGDRNFWSDGCFENITIPSEYSGESVIKIGNDAFKDLGKLSGKLIIPDTVISIGENAFYSAFDLSEENELQLGSVVASVGKNAFANDNFVGELHLSSTLTSLGDDAFKDNKFNGTLIIPGSIKNVNKAFKCNTFSGVIFGEGVEKIGEDAFSAYNCLTKKTIESVSFPDSLSEIGKYAFRYQLISGELNIPESVEFIRNGSFEESKIEKINFLGDSRLKIIEGRAFYKVSTFNGELIIPDNVTEIGEDAFNAGKMGSHITTLSLGKKVQSVGNRAFLYNAPLEKIDLSNVQTIGSKAFDTIKIPIYIPDTVVEIDSDAFQYYVGNNRKTNTGYVTLDRDINYSDVGINPLIRLYKYTFVDEGGSVLGTGYYQSGIVSDMSKIIPIEYYTEGEESTILLDNLIDKNSINDEIVWEGLPSDKIATEDKVITGHLIKKYTITFHFADNTTETEIINEGLTGTSKNVTLDEGYNFEGWYEKNGSEWNDNSFDFENTLVTRNIDLYEKIDCALGYQWNEGHTQCSLVTYTIIYNDADGLVDGFDASYNVNSSTINLQSPSKSGWNFMGWYTNAEKTEGPITSIEHGSVGNKTFYAKWTGKTFTVNFNANGAEINDNSETCTVTDGSTCNVSSLPTITRDGFDIKGWSTNQNATIADIATNGTITLSETNDGATYYAITEKKVTVVFSGNGNGTYDDQICYIRNTASNCSVTAPIITAPEGFDVIGWSTTTGNHSDQWTSTPFTDDAVYYAQTKSSNPYTVTYYGNGNTLFGDITEKVESCYRYNNEATCEVSVPSIQSNLPNTPTVIGYISHPGTGNVPAEIGGVELNSTAISNNNLKINISSDTNLYAVTYAAPKTYHVTYVKGDSGVVGIGDGESSCLIPATYNGVAQALSCTITAPSISTNDDRTGNWGYDTNGKLIKYQDEIVIYADNTPVVAHSEGIYYVVSYILDGGEFPEGVVDTGSYQKGTGFTLPIPVKDGYTFLNWKNAQTQEVVTAISDEDEGAKTFIATWRKDSFKITYDNVGYDLTSLPKSYAYGSETSVPDLPDSARRGYVFAGWTWEGQNNPTTGAVISAAQEGDIEFVAHWNVREYTITYNTKNGVVTPANANPTTYTVESDDIHLVNPTRANSVFEGWMLEPVTVAVNDVYIYNGSIGDRTYTAKFSCEDGYQLNNDGTSCDLIEYDVTYKLNGGDNNEKNPEKVSKNGSTYTITVYNPVKTGFTFEGWTTNIADYTCTTNGGQELEVCKSNNSTTPIKVVFNKGQNVKLTANWEHVKIDVTTANYFTNNQTTQNLTTKEYNYGGIINIYTGDIVGYQTTGWSTTAGGEIVFRNGESKLVSELESYITYSDSNANGRVSLYAVRKPITYTIVYDVDGGVNDPANPSERLITDVSFELKAPVKTGYDFVAWKTNKGVVVEDITKELLGSLEAPYTLYLKALYEPRTDTKYAVYHVKQWIDGSYNTGAETTEIFTGEGTTDSPVTPEVRTYVGFTSPQQTTKDIAPDGKMYIIYNYVRAKNNYTYNTAVGATTKWKTPLVGWSSEETTEEIFYETPIILTGEANIGYTWSGWDVTIGGVTTRINNQTYTFDMPLDDVVVTPVVDHNKWTLRFDVNGGIGDADALAESYPVYYDDAISYPVVTRMGYTFLGWYDDVTNTRYGSGTEDGNLKMPNSDLTLTAHWQANDFTLNVNHYKMNLSGEYSETPNKIVQIETKIDADLTGTVNTGILPENYTGFTLSGDAVETIHINPDGSSVINYYYSRDRHNVRINENEGVILSGTLSGEYYYETPVAVEALAKTGYTWSGWNVTSGGETVFTDLTGVEFILSTGDVELTPFVTVNEYHLTVKDGSTIIFSGDVLYKTNISTYLGSLSKNGYTFNGWTNRPANDLMPANDLVIEAKWTKITPAGGGGGGGGGSSSSSDTNKDKTPVTTGAQEQEHGSAELTGEVKKVDEPKEEKEEVKSEVKPIENMEFEEIKDINANQLNKVDRKKLTKEQNEILDAYQWAYEHNVTTMVTLRDANPEGVVTRGHLAKMVVNYATNVLGQKIPEKIPSECRWNDYRGDWESQEIKDYAVKACALGLMGLDMKKFQPKVWVSRAQFGTIMSRLLWGKKYAGGKPYYRNHLNALKTNGIMTQIGNPEGRTELRQWVWLMLMRAGLEK